MREWNLPSLMLFTSRQLVCAVRAWRPSGEAAMPVKPIKAATTTVESMLLIGPPVDRSAIPCAAYSRPLCLLMQAESGGLLERYGERRRNCFPALGGWRLTPQTPEDASENRPSNSAGGRASRQRDAVDPRQELLPYT